MYLQKADLNSLDCLTGSVRNLVTILVVPAEFAELILIHWTLNPVLVQSLKFFKSKRKVVIDLGGYWDKGMVGSKSV